MSPSVPSSLTTDVASALKQVTFIQYSEPPLKADEYTLSVVQTTNTEAPNQSSLTRNFVVSGERFTFKSGEVAAVFPPPLANGEFDGTLAQAVLSRTTLPWERYLDTTNPELPWLAVLLFDEGNHPTVTNLTASDLIQLGQAVTVVGGASTGVVGKLPTGYISYPTINPLDYAETPSDACAVIDIPVGVFSQVAPSKNDLSYLAHVRQVDSIDSAANKAESTVAVVVGNRLPQTNTPAYAYLVSLEGMSAFLPGDDGTPAQFPAGTQCIRLICYRSWRFTANTLDQNFQQLLENLNSTQTGPNRFTTLQYPTPFHAPTTTDVQPALARQAQGQLTDSDAQILALNAFAMGYVPMNHRLRHAGTTVSWYRGPCMPFAANGPPLSLPITCPDAANRYNPQTGLFDVSYGAAWQLGQLLALQNSTFANALFNWKKSVTLAEAAAQEQAVLCEKLGNGAAFAELLRLRDFALSDPPPLPDVVTQWLGKLRLLHGVPFSYLVPDESMLPLESLRFFVLDVNWIDALLDGAFSIGRTSSAEVGSDQRRFAAVRAKAAASSVGLRRHRDTVQYLDNPGETYTGFLLRSEVVSGWPNIRANGYTVPDDITTEVRKLRMERISDNCLICIFDGDVKQVALHEPPEQLHCGIEGTQTPYTTTLRAVTGATPGIQFESDPKGGDPVAVVPARADPQTLQIANAATNILNKLNTDFAQGIPQITSAEFTLEMIKGVVKVDFNLVDSQPGGAAIC